MKRNQQSCISAPTLVLVSLLIATSPLFAQYVDAQKPASIIPIQAQTSLVYETGVGKGGFEGWNLTASWNRLNDMLVTDGTARGGFVPVLAPYRPEFADYAVEAEIRTIQRPGNSYGIAVRANGEQGYAVGVGTSTRRVVGTTICYLSGNTTPFITPGLYR